MLDYLYEFLGTMLLVYTILSTGNAFAIGIALTVGILLDNGKSGAHFNPAVTLSALQNGNIRKNKVIPYILSQIAGGAMAVQLNNMT